MQTFTQNIEQVILENFGNAKTSITIVVAWFTNQKIISRLIELKKSKNLKIQILVDNNQINQKYFFELHASNLIDNGVEIMQQHISRFNHNKFAIIDNEVLITGSYNYTNKANRNFENIIVEHDSRIANFYFRLFRFFTEKDYIDPNVQILFDKLDFANQLIAAYYPFSSKLLSKLEDKINLGYCFTHENGLYNEISYEPGLIFNPKFMLHKKLKAAINKQKTNSYSIDEIHDYLRQEFDLPITKDLIKSFKAYELNNFNYQTLQEIAYHDKIEIDYEELAKDFENTEIAISNYYTRKFETIYTNEELIKIVENKIDLVIEDYIWANNFAPFLTDQIVANIYSKIKVSDIYYF